MDQAGLDTTIDPHRAALPEAPFAALLAGIQPQDALRRRITEAYRLPEADCVTSLLAEATVPEAVRERARHLAGRVCRSLRAKGPAGGVEGLIQEFDLSSREGVSLMCLAEALLRIPDTPTRDALIKDRIAGGAWSPHLGRNHPLLVNAATLGLMVGGRLTSAAGLLGRGSRPAIRQATAIGMRLLGRQFVTGRTIDRALANSRRLEARGFRYSYDMLGETATTAEDTDRYMADYDRAIHAIGRRAAGRGLYDGPGISIKLSALHPRYSRAQRERVMGELYGRIRTLALLARRYDIGLTIDAEEADRLDLSLDLMQQLCRDPALSGWDGIGMVVQAYQKRARFVIDFLIALARGSGHRLMIRLCKGAYWDSEVKRAQVDGLDDFPVYTRKVHTDLSYIACANRLLAAPDAVFPQFATHNALTMATIYCLAGESFHVGQYEFQGLHGMGEPLYAEVVGADKLNRPCRLYAPVGTPETLLAYLVRRLLENGANSSFVNKIGDPSVPLDALLVDPVDLAQQVRPVGAPHERIALPRRLFGAVRDNSAGFDPSNEQALAALAEALAAGNRSPLRARPMLGDGAVDGPAQPVLNPADRRDVVGSVVKASADDVDRALALAESSAWPGVAPADRADCLVRAADLMERCRAELFAIIVREGGKSLPNAVAEVREAVDFLRYYAAEVARSFDNATHRPLGPVACISPWNFPLAIFVGQLSAALAAGNPVVCKPASAAPLIAARAVALLHEAGVPPDALQLLPGDGATGTRLVGDARVKGVMFTGSTDVARLIQRRLADRLNPDGLPVPLIAETGGQNAMIVDSSALPEQVVADVLQSAFDSAGQRCSALRLLCLQREVADKVLHILEGAMAELTIGRPDRLSTDVGPLINDAAASPIRDHIEAMKRGGCRTVELPLPAGTERGSFVAPTIVEIDRISQLSQEVFGPVLHVLRFAAERIDQLVDDINATGYGLTFGIHSRVPSTIDRVSRRIKAGNIYVNRNMIGAVVGVQPFGGRGLSGTGPKAGGPLYLYRLLSVAPTLPAGVPAGSAPPAAHRLADWLQAVGRPALAERIRCFAQASPSGRQIHLPGPVGEHNVYSLQARGRILCLADSENGLFLQLGAALATGNHALLPDGSAVRAAVAALPAELDEHFTLVADDVDTCDCQAVLLEGDEPTVIQIARRIAGRPGAILPLVALSPAALAAGEDYPLRRLVEERSVSTNTAASGNTALAIIG
jgi:RHH-type proline utilization regulon transcriptional repressor/proline dehydrogenase/delta 1-pyrroline-5-carboxylate dehydrogenase